MSGRRESRDGRRTAFARERHRWIARVMKDRRFTGNEKTVATCLAQVHLNFWNTSAWPSHALVARETCVSEKTVQRAVNKLARFGYIEIDRRSRRTNTYVFTPISDALQSPSKAGQEGGHTRPSPRTRESAGGGQLSPPNLNKEHIEEPYARPVTPRCGISRFAPGSTNARDWSDALSARGLNSLDAWKVRRWSPDGTQEYEMPHLWPPRDEDEWPIVEQYLAWRGAAAEAKEDC